MTGDLQILQMARKGAELTLAEIDSQIAQLTGAKPGRPAREPGKRTMSVKARKAIADAQKKRWADFHAKKTPTGETEPIKPKATKRAKVKMSSAAKKRIQEANKKRWAEYRAKKANAVNAKTAAEADRRKASGASG